MNKRLCSSSASKQSRSRYARLRSLIYTPARQRSPPKPAIDKAAAKTGSELASRAQRQETLPVCRSWPVYAAVPSPPSSSSFLRFAVRPRCRAPPQAPVHPSRLGQPRSRHQFLASLLRCRPFRTRHFNLRPKDQSRLHLYFYHIMTIWPGLLSEAASCHPTTSKTQQPTRYFAAGSPSKLAILPLIFPLSL